MCGFDCALQTFVKICGRGGLGRKSMEEVRRRRNMCMTLLWLINAPLHQEIGSSDNAQHCLKHIVPLMISST